MHTGFQIAIDGPVAAGKSTVARRLAERVGFVYVDTGAMYRAITLMASRRGIAYTDEEALARLVREVFIDVRRPIETEQDGRLSTVTVDGEDVSWAIRSGDIAQHVATVASLARVREELVIKQRYVAEGKDVVMEGRDITYVVLPEADLKIFLDAKEDVRIERYYRMMMTEGKTVDREEAASWLRNRDELDRTRAVSPLKIVEGVWVLDSSEKSVDQVVDEIAERVQQLRVA